MSVPDRGGSARPPGGSRPRVRRPANVGNLFRPLSDDEAWAVLDAAWESGIRFYDTAPHYGLACRSAGSGRSCRPSRATSTCSRPRPGACCGRTPTTPAASDTANDFHVPDDLQRVVGLLGGGHPRERRRVSRERLGIERIDLLYLHDPERHDLDLALAEAPARDGAACVPTARSPRSASARWCRMLSPQPCVPPTST